MRDYGISENGNFIAKLKFLYTDIGKALNVQFQKCFYKSCSLMSPEDRASRPTLNYVLLGQGTKAE